MHVPRFQKSPRGRPNDGHSAVLDGGDGVCPGMEVLQERQREDALLCPGSRVQRVCMMLNSAIHFLVLFEFELTIGAFLRAELCLIMQMRCTVCPRLFLCQSSPHLFSCPCTDTKAPLRGCKVETAPGFLGPYSPNFLCSCFFVTLRLK